MLPKKKKFYKELFIKIFANRNLHKISSMGLRKLCSKDYIILLKFLSNSSNNQVTGFKVRTAIRKCRQGDIKHILKLYEETMDLNELKELSVRISMLKRQYEDCYVATSNNDKVCFIMWLITSREIDKLNDQFKGGFSKINSDELIIEGVYTFPKYRNQKIFKDAFRKIISNVIEENTKDIFAYVKANNMPSLKAFKELGFQLHGTKRNIWLLGVKKSYNINTPKKILDLWRKI